MCIEFAKSVFSGGVVMSVSFYQDKEIGVLIVWAYTVSPSS